MTSEDLDRITPLFKGKSVFISGASGFLGKVLIEKLLRVTEVKTLYLLIRQKKNKCPKDRMAEMFNGVLFALLRKEKPDVFKKCVVIPGDVLETNLGITEVDRTMLQNEVHFIFHSAASTRFDDPLPYAVKMNTLGTKYMLDLAKQCKKLTLFIHVSTCFAFPSETVLYEKPYDPPTDPVEVLSIVNSPKTNASRQDIDKILLGDSPNTYTYSKALAEGLVNREMGKLPVIIVRPSVVIPTYKEPITGFFGSLESPMGIFIGAGKGVIRSVYIDSKANANLIPADCVINGMIVAAWDYLTTRKQNVFNITIPREDLTISWEDIIELGKDVLYNRVPFNMMMWYPNGVMTKVKIWHYFNVIMFQIIPALFLDLVLYCLGYKPLLYNINKRILRGQEMFEYFTTRAWNFNLEYFLNMRRRMTKKEKEVYMIEAENTNIKEYLYECCLYARRNIFHETDDMLPAAKRNLKILFVLDRIFKISFFVLVFYYIYKLFS